MPAITKPTPFGNYLLLDLIASGGMAEVFRAATVGFAGFQRLIAIKRILSQCAADKHFINMLIDEARIAVQLSNPNIVQVLELGIVDGKYYIAMEYVAGRDLRKFMTRLMREKTTMPVAVAAYIMSSVCSALDHAHRKTGPDGLPLNIVHRDVSPHNVLVGFDGSVKVADFGIAKAENRVSETLVGTIKGKFSYMAPDQIRGEELDHRADIFCVGILLYEVLTGARLFGAASDVQNLQAVRVCKIARPRTINPHIPASLERVIMRALAPYREDRYQWASEMFDDLQPFLIEERSVFTAQKMRAYLESYEPAAIASERQHTEELMQAAERYGPVIADPPALLPVNMPTAKLNLESLQAGAVILAVGTGERTVSAELSSPGAGPSTPPDGVKPVQVPATYGFSSLTVIDPGQAEKELAGRAPASRGPAVAPAPLPADELGPPTAIESVATAPGMSGPDTTPGAWTNTPSAAGPVSIAEETTVPVSATDSPFAARGNTVVVEPPDKVFRQEFTAPAPFFSPLVAVKSRLAQSPWLVAGCVALLALAAVLFWPKRVPEMPTPAARPVQPVSPAANALATEVREPAAEVTAAPSAQEQARADLSMAKKVIESQIRKLELRSGDVPAMDQQRQRLAALIKDDRPEDALDVATRIVSALDAVTIDEAFVVTKRERLNKLAGPVEDDALRQQIDEATNDATAAIRAGDYKLANRQLNRAFRLVKGVR
jgi:serine/threonine protein kinase